MFSQYLLEAGELSSDWGERRTKIYSLARDLSSEEKALVGLFLDGDEKIRTRMGSIRHAERLLNLIQGN